MQPANEINTASKGRKTGRYNIHWKKKRETWNYEQEFDEGKGTLE